MLIIRVNMKPTRIKRQKLVMSFLICILYTIYGDQMHCNFRKKQQIEKCWKSPQNTRWIKQHGGYGWEHLQYFCIKLKSVLPLRDTVACISWTDRATVKSLIGLETSRLKNLWLLLCWCFQNGSDKWHIYFTKKPSNSALSKGCTICFIVLLSRSG